MKSLSVVSRLKNVYLMEPELRSFRYNYPTPKGRCLTFRPIFSGFGIRVKENY